MLPYLEVARLPPSSSFYAAILQPLGLRYLSAATEPCPSITFGHADTRVPVFEIRQVTPSGARPPKRSRICVAAISAAAVGDSYRLALTSASDSQSQESPEAAADGGGVICSGADDRRLTASGSRSGQSPHPSAVLRHPPGTETKTDATEATITDLDGNIMDIIYHPYPSHSLHDGSTLRKTQSTNAEATRILDWNFDVASSNAPSVVSVTRGNSSSHEDGHHLVSSSVPEDRIFRRSVTTTTTTTSVLEPPETTPVSTQQSSGNLTGTVVGTLLGAAFGVAAGAAVTYGVMRGERARAFRQEVEPTPIFTRRSTFPEDYSMGVGQGRFVEVERRIEKIRFPEDYQFQQARGRPPPPEYIASYSQAPPPTKVPKAITERGETYDEDSRSHHSSRSRISMRSGTRIRARSRSEAGSAMHAQPLPLTEAEHQSHVSSSKGSKYPPIVQRSYSYDIPERGEEGGTKSRRGSASASASATGSYVSARSHHSSSTIRATPAPAPAPAPSPAAPPSRAHTYRMAREFPMPPIPVRGGRSHVSARRVPLPASTCASGQVRDDDGDDDSIAPSDSISNVGSRKSHRSRYY